MNGDVRLRRISGGDDPPADNPYAAFGLNPDGTPLKEPVKEPPKADEVTAALTAKVTKLETDLKALGDKQAPLEQKAALLDRMAAALTGTGLPDPNADNYQKVWGELKDVMRVASPAFYKLLLAAEKDPDLLDRMQRQQDVLGAGRLVDLNTAAHTAIMGAAKGVFRNASADELAEIVLPFEKTITDIINANKELRSRFITGDTTVAIDVFNRLVRPHQAMRLRSKQTALKTSDLPLATPRGAGAPTDTGGADGSLVRQKGADGKPKFDLRSPAGRMAFHRAAVARFSDRRTTEE